MIILKHNLFLVSTSPDLNKIPLKPTIPNNFLTKEKFMDWKTPRFMLYPTIDEALGGGNFLGQNLEGMELYVYRALGTHKNNILEPNIKEVPYKLQLNEKWYCIPLQFELLEKIKIGKQKKILEYHYGPRSTVGKIYMWNWKIMRDKYGRKLKI